MKNLLLKAALLLTISVSAQSLITPEKLWQLGRVGAVGISRDGRNVIYRVGSYSIEEDKSSARYYSVSLDGGAPIEVAEPGSFVRDHNISPDGKYTIEAKEVKLKKVYGKDFYPELSKSNVQVYDNLNYRHWDTWEDGEYSHLFVFDNQAKSEGIDLMKDEPFDCPQKPFGGEEDYVWSPDSKYILYVTKKKYGKDYAVSTNSDIYQYELASGKTTNLTEGMKGYDTSPQFSSRGDLAWLSMKRDGYESDKNDIVLKTSMAVINVTQGWDGTVNSLCGVMTVQKFISTQRLMGLFSSLK